MIAVLGGAFMRAIWFLLLLVFVQRAGGQDYHCNCVCKQKNKPECRAAMKESDCKSLCTQQVCGGDTLKDAGEPVRGYCTVPDSTHPPTRGALGLHVLHAIWHQPGNLWSGNGDTIVDINEARDRLLAAAGDDKTHKADQAQALLEIRSASDDELKQAIPEAIEECKSKYGRNIVDHFAMVWLGDGGRYWLDLLDDRSKGNVEGIRRLYSQAQSANRDLVNLLDCYSGSEIITMAAAAPQPSPQSRGIITERNHPTRERNAGADHGGPAKN